MTQFCILEAQEIAQSTPDPFPREGVGSGNETTFVQDHSFVVKTYQVC